MQTLRRNQQFATEWRHSADDSNVTNRTRADRREMETAFRECTSIMCVCVGGGAITHRQKKMKLGELVIAKELAVEIG